MAKMTNEEMISNDALSKWLETNHDGKWERHFGTFDSIVWNSGEVAPAESTWTSDKTTHENSEKGRILRSGKYPGFGEQLDLLYHDMLADNGNKTGTWFAAVKAVKDANPK